MKNRCTVGLNRSHTVQKTYGSRLPSKCQKRILYTQASCSTRLYRPGTSLVYQLCINFAILSLIRGINCDIRHGLHSSTIRCAAVFFYGSAQSAPQETPVLRIATIFYGAVRCILCLEFYGAVRCGFVRGKIVRCGAVRSNCTAPHRTVRKTAPHRKKHWKKRIGDQIDI